MALPVFVSPLRSLRADWSPASLYARAQTWLIGSDPGLLRLHTAGRTTVTLAVALVILYLATKATGQPLTVALLGVVIAMQAAMAVKESDPRQQKITMALLPLPAIAAVVAGALLVPHKVASDVAFVLIIFAAVYVRRFDTRGTALGMVAFMAYFFALFLGATTAQLPKLVVAIVIGTLCSYLIRVYVIPDRPERVLQRTVRSFWTRVAAVVEISGESLRSGRFDERQRRRLRDTVARLNETVVMVESQIDDKADTAALWPGIPDDELAVRLFDIELAAERLAAACVRAVAVVGDMSDAARAVLLEALAELREASREPSDERLERAAQFAQELFDRSDRNEAGDPHAPEVRQVAVAIIRMTDVAAKLRTLAREVTAEPDAVEPIAPETSGTEDGEVVGLRPTTRLAIQVAVAASLAIVAGELVSPARWYWAVITAFIVFTGTTSSGEILSKGWQRLVGTMLGVPAGVLVATAVSGHTVASVVLIFACLFFGFYFMKVAYSLMAFCITTMLALLYGLMGQFSVNVLLLRIEETAIGAVIGMAVAALILPTRTRESVRADTVTFLATLSEVVDASVARLRGVVVAASPTERARQLHRQLQQLRVSAKPLTSGIAGIGSRDGIRRALRVVTVCDYQARVLARCAERPDREWVAIPALGRAIESAAAGIRDNIEVLTADPAQRDQGRSVESAIGFLEAADNLVGRGDGLPGWLRPTLHSLRAIDAALVELAAAASPSMVDGLR